MTRRAVGCAGASLGPSGRRSERPPARGRRDSLASTHHREGPHRGRDAEVPGPGGEGRGRDEHRHSARASRGPTLTARPGRYPVWRCALRAPPSSAPATVRSGILSRRPRSPAGRETAAAGSRRVLLGVRAPRREPWWRRRRPL